MKRIQMARVIAIAVAMVGLFAAHSVQAQVLTATGNLAVSASVTKACTVGLAGAINFGTYDPNSGAALDGQGSFTLTCTKGVSYTIALDNGTNYDTVNSIRRMAGGTDFLQYRLFTSAARTTDWTTTSTVPGTAASRLPATVNVYGTIPANQDVGAFTFSDTVLITVTY